MVRINKRNPEGVYQAIAILCILLIKSSSVEGDNVQTSFSVSSGDSPGVTEVSTARGCNHIDAEANKLTIPDPKCAATIGSECTLSCIKNFMTDNSSIKQTVTCTDEGWAPAIRKCKAIQCEPWILLANQVYIIKNCTANRDVKDTCRISCRDGHELETPPPDGKEGYFINCKLNTTTKTSAYWSDKQAPACQAITCPPWELGNNLEIKSGNCAQSRQVSATCEVGCKGNFRFNPPQESKVLNVTCRWNRTSSTAMWVPQHIPTCQAITCTPFKFPAKSRYDMTSCSSNEVGKNCTIRCQSRYKFNDSTTQWSTSCKLQAGGVSAEWTKTNPPICEAITCPPPPIDSNQVFTNSGGCEGRRQLNSHCSIGCGENFKFTSPPESRKLQCKFNRRTKSANWTPAPMPECVAYECEQRKIREAKNYQTRSCPGSKSVDSMCPVSCKSGYRFDDEVHAVNISCKLRLTDGQKVAYWDIDEAPSCKKIECNEVSLTNHRHYETKLCSRKKLGSRCSIKCKTGYTINSISNEKAIICDLKKTNEFVAEWKIGNAPTCKEITCNDITGRENLKVAKPCGNSINTTCDLSCSANHKFPSPWASREDTLQAKCVIAGSGTTADWKIEKSSQTELDTIPDRCEEIRCSSTTMTGNYKTKTCGSAPINGACQLQCKNGFKFSDNKTEKDVTCTSNGDKTASWPSPGCIQIKCENVTSSSFGTPADNFKEKRPIPDANCRQGSSCSLSCDKGYSLSEKTLKCNTAVEKWSPHPADVGLCKPTIEGTKRKCDYWISGFKIDSNAADNHCRLVLGPTAALAMPRHMADELKQWIPGADHLLVGAYISRGMPYWNDGITLKGKGIPKNGSGSFCVARGKTEFSIFKCGSTRYKFMCERPKANNDPCRDESVCNVGNCTTVGCSYRCTCPDKIYGRHCEKGPFTKNITKLTRDSVRIYLKNNAKNETARYSIFLNGQEINSSTLEEGEEVWTTHQLHQNERNNFVSLVTSLVNRPDVSQSECLILKNPNGRDRVNITNDKCDPTVLNVFWEGFGKNSGHSTDYSVYVGSTRKESSQAGSWIKLSGLKRDKQYNIRVLPTIEGCKSYSLFEARKVNTSYGGPDAPNITKLYLEPVQASTQNCSIAWTVEKPNNSAGYTVKFVEEDRVTRNPSKQQFVTVAPFMSFYSFRTKPNSIYRISVSTKGPFGCDNVPEKWSKDVSGCETDRSAPSVIRDDLITVSQQNKFPRVTLNQVDERNGPISCYLVIVQVALSSSNSSKVATTINDLKQVNDSVNAGDNYIAIAVKRHEVGKLLHLGNGNISCCNLRNGSAPCTLHSKQERQKRAASPEDDVRGENRPLDPNQNYRHYVLIATPRSNGGDPILTASPLSDVWKIPTESAGQGSNSPIAIVIPAVIVILLIVIIAGFVVYRRSQVTKKPHYPSLRANPESPSVEAGEFIGMEENSDSIIDRELSNLSLRLSDLFHAINTKRENDDMHFLQEFKKSILDAVKQCNLTCEIAHLSVNQPKNRFKNIVPYDRFRVSLSNVPGIEFSDYVNASYIDGYSHPRKFIATQGPKPETIEDFWRMLWEQNCRVIVMLTRLKERMKVKCAQYWPDEGVTADHNGIKVTLHETISYGDFVKRRIVVTRNNETVEVTQFHFVAWPDHGVPSTTSSLLRFHDYVVNAQPSNAGPIIVHCSAGVGRTGTFIALNHLHDQIMEMNEINVAVVIGRMRTRRPEMVQTLQQYILIHKLVLELYQFGVTDRDISEFNSAIQDLNRGTLNIAQEFEMLNYFMPLDTSQDYGRKEGNARLNRNPSILPYDHNRAFIQMEPNDREVPYYNASIVASYELSNQCIAAQSPDEQSLELFWRTVLNNDVNAIVALGARNEIQSYWPEVSKSEKYGIVTVRTFEEKTDNKGVTERILEVSNKTKKITLLQVYFDGWPDHGVPAGSEAVLEIISKIEKHYQTLSDQEKRTTIVHCSDGSGRTGTFLAISNLIERLKNENKVDIFRMAKDLRDLRPGMIETAEQYAFCYKAVSEYLQLFDLYGNFQ